MGKIKIILCLVIFGYLCGCANTGGSHTKKAISLVEQADHYYALGLLSDAEAKYRKILQQYPDYHEAWLKLGNIYIRTDQLDAAIIAYEGCGKRMPEDVRCWNNLALARIKQAMNTLEEGKSKAAQGSDGYYALDKFQMKIVGLLSSEK